MLFSAVVGPIVAPGAPTTQPHAAVKVAAVGTGVTLQLQAGVAFTGQVAFIPSSASGLGPSATIDWGDGTTTAATFQVTTQAGVTGYEVIGSHTYADPGTYDIVTTMQLTPITQPGEPTPQFIVADPPMISTAIVAPAAPTGSTNPDTTGVTIHEVAGVQFTADLGSFATLAPGTRLRARINWGDGKTSLGTLISTGPVNFDEISFEVTGSHKYAHAGTYAIAIHVVKLPLAHPRPSSTLPPSTPSPTCRPSRRRAKRPRFQVVRASPECRTALKRISTVVRFAIVYGCRGAAVLLAETRGVSPNAS